MPCRDQPLLRLPLTCAQLDDPERVPSTQLEKPAPDHSGSVLIDCRWHPAAGATRVTGCSGPIFYLRVRNNSPTTTARALLPNKKAGNPWLDGAPGTDVSWTPPCDRLTRTRSTPWA
jgi:hypothetical protein